MGLYWMGMKYPRTYHFDFSPGVSSDDNFNKCVAKWVRNGHVQTGEHWMNSEMICNRLGI
jgi:hypothetical protein